MPTGVLVSGGLDSAVLLAEEASLAEVQPLYVGVGLFWEVAEREALAAFLATATLPAVRPLVCLTVDMGDVYPPSHWARRGTPPGYRTADEEVYLPGRNVVLLGKAGVFCASAHIERLVIGTLDHNPFPDATPAFRSAMASTLSLGLGQPFAIEAPYARVSKADVIRRGAARHLPLALTLSCMSPRGRGRVDFSGTAIGATEPAFIEEAPRAVPEKSTRPRYRHCGVCSKCRERHEGFVEAGIADPTDYVDRTYTS
jgi:7-cyano-7-deazaguanine synthase